MSIRPESRLKFEKQGVFSTKLNIQMGNMDGREQQEAVGWIAEQEHNSNRQENIRYGLMLFFAVVAALAGSIAAWPIVKEWLVK